LTGLTLRWRLLPWLANPDIPAMSPQAVRGTGTHHTVETEERGRERDGRVIAYAMRRSKNQASVTLTRQWEERKGQGRGNSL